MVIGVKEEASPPFFGVEKSVTGKLWRLRLKDERLVLAFSQNLSYRRLLQE